MRVVVLVVVIEGFADEVLINAHVFSYRFTKGETRKTYKTV